MEREELKEKGAQKGPEKAEQEKIDEEKSKKKEEEEKKKIHPWILLLL